MTESYFEHDPVSRQLSAEPSETTPASRLEALVSDLEGFAFRSLVGYRSGYNIVYEPPAQAKRTSPEGGTSQSGKLFSVNLGVHGDLERVVVIEVATDTGREVGTVPFGDGEAGHWHIRDNGVAISDKAGPGIPGVNAEMWAQEQLAAFKERADDASQRGFFRVEQTIEAAA